MDMEEIIDGPIHQRRIDFKLVDSMMFSSFDGYWLLRYHSRSRYFDDESKTYKFKYRTLLTYSVYVRPQGVVPVLALEWRIREDVPTNINAVKVAAESLSRRSAKSSAQSQEAGGGWGSDETLAVYIRNSIE